MKFLNVIYFIVLFASCKNSLTDFSYTLDRGFKTMTILNKLDTCFISVPSDYDTTVSWLDKTGCRYSDELNFRFQTTKLKVLKENCFDHSFPMSFDTVDRITLTFAKYPSPPASVDSILFYEYHYRTIAESEISDAFGFDIPYDTVEIINERLFSIILFTGSNSKKSAFSKKLKASTISGENLISLSYEIFTNKPDLSNDAFVRYSKAYLTRTRISNGK